MDSELTFFDDLKRKVVLAQPPNRIVSLCPSITETLYDLGLEDRIIGRTRFCIHPQEKVKQAERVGGTKEVKFDRLHRLKPDLIIGEKEENTPEMIAELEKHYPVYVVDVRDVNGGLQMIERLGDLTGSSAKAKEWVGSIFFEKNKIQPLSKPLKVAYLIWKDPWMGVGKDTYIHSVLELMGWENVLTKLPGRYPELDLALLAEGVVDLVLLSSEPYPFRESHVGRIKDFLPHATVRLVDGEMFSWYGSRMKMAFPYLQKFQEQLKK